MERTVCDILRSRNRIDIQIFSDALKKAAKIFYKIRTCILDLCQYRGSDFQINDDRCRYKDLVRECFGKANNYLDIIPI